VSVEQIAPWYALAHLDPDAFDRMPAAQAIVTLGNFADALRPEQVVPRKRFRSLGMITGRGGGKTTGLTLEVNRRVRAGECRSLALMAPTEQRVSEVQIANLINLSPLDFRAERYAGSVRWPNGVVAEVFTPEAPGRSRSGNFDLAWLTELVDWAPNTRREAFDNVTTATRVGSHACYLWDTTSRGKNDVIQLLLAEHERDPARHIIRRGTMFDNYALPGAYMRDEVAKYVVGSRLYDEEILGLVFTEAAGALWRQEWLDEHRRAAAPSASELSLLGLDPALSKHRDADAVGLVRVERDRDGELYVTRDFSERMTPDEYASIVIAECARDCAGVVLERNHAGDHPRDIIRAKAELKGMRVEVLAPERKFPRRSPGTIYIREVVSTRDKESRASAPAALYQARRVHHIGVHAALELELTTWEPGSSRSPNRLDALTMAINELAGLTVPGRHDGKRAVAAARDVHDALRDALRGTGGSRWMGL
jgi:phage terminase large subunit-like protein